MSLRRRPETTEMVGQISNLPHNFRRRIDMKKFYFVAMIIGASIPLYLFVSFFAEHGLDLAAFLESAFANKASSGLIADLLISAVIALIFIGQDARKLGINKLWLVLLGTCLIGLSFSLPFYLYLREARAEEQRGFAVSGGAKSVAH